MTGLGAEVPAPESALLLHTTSK